MTVFAEFQGHSLLHHPFIIKAKPPDKTLLSKSIPVRMITQSLGLHFPLPMRSFGLAFLNEDRIIIKLKIPIANIERVLLVPILSKYFTYRNSFNLHDLPKRDIHNYHTHLTNEETEDSLRYGEEQVCAA